ncbi:MAG: M48 family metallopeptidase [Phycisphaeraceae bacterium]|nr:M48 family metallopeptidase [Phycisphaeraceae bacterium]
MGEETSLRSQVPTRLESGAGHVEGSALMFAPAFTGRWAPIARTSGYQLALFASAVFMTLMPLLYFAAIGAIGWAVYWHFTHDTGMLHTRATGRGAAFMFLLYILPGVAGIVLIAFLLRPLIFLFGTDDNEDRIEVFPREEPRLFAFVEMVCQTMGAPIPERIFINCEANAAAQLLGGGFGLFGRRRLALHVGLPLVAGLSATSFAGILAHEFGHFSQGAGMRATSILGRMSRWMGMAAYDRSGIDASIHGLTQSGTASLAFIGVVLLICVGIARLILKFVFFLGFGVSRIMGRRMEFDADAHEARFVGSKAAIETWPRLLGLIEAVRQADAKIADQWKNRTLPEDFPALVASTARRLSPDDRADLKRACENKHTGWFDTHPATGIRIRSMESLKEPGVFRLDEPATSLFTNFGDASKKASYAFFKERVGEYIFSATFVRSADLFGSHEEESRAAAVPDFLGFEPPDWRPLWLGMESITPPSDPKACWERVRAARQTLAKAGPAAASALDEFLASDQTLLQTETAPVVFSLGISSIKKEFQFKFTDSRAMSREKDKAVEIASRTSAPLDDALDAAAARVAGNLRMLAVPGIEKRIDGAPKMLARAKELANADFALRRAFSQVKQLRENFQRAILLIPYLDDARMKEKARESFRPITDLLRDGVIGMRQDLGGVKSPYPGPDGETNLGGLIFRKTPAWREYNQIMGAASDGIQKFTETQRRIMSELVELASRTESGLRNQPASKAAGASAETGSRSR